MQWLALPPFVSLATNCHLFILFLDTFRPAPSSQGPGHCSWQWSPKWSACPALARAPPSVSPPAPSPQPALPMKCQHWSSKSESEFLPASLSSRWPKRDHDALCRHIAGLHWGRRPGLGCKTQFPGQTICCHPSLLSHPLFLPWNALLPVPRRPELVISSFAPSLPLKLRLTGHFF